MILPIDISSNSGNNWFYPPNIGYVYFGGNGFLQIQSVNSNSEEFSISSSIDAGHVNSMLVIPTMKVRILENDCTEFVARYYSIAPIV